MSVKPRGASAVEKIDREILLLLEKRAKAVQSGGPLPARLSELKLAQQRGLSQRALKAIYAEIESGCRECVKPVKVGYLGPKATFTHQATLKHFGGSTDLSPKRTIADVFAGVESGSEVFGVVPIENSTEGVVTHTLDMFIDSNLNIVTEIILKIEHHLASRTKTPSRMKRLYSHPQSLAQCRSFVQAELGHLEIIETSSNSRSADLASKEKGAAAITTALAAKAWKLHVVKNNVQDFANNATRFFVLGQSPKAASGQDRTSLMVSLKDKVGALHHALEPFSRFKINMTKIESRPSKRQAWEYLFFIDCEGHISDRKVGKAIEGLDEHCNFVKVLGSYPISKGI